MPCALRLSEAASLAMHAMGLLAVDHGQSLSTRQIAGCFEVSEAHLSKVMQRLVKVGLLTSVRGPKGGFSLARHPADITLLQVFEAIEGPVEPTGCMLNVPTCDGQSCLLGRVMVDANAMLLDHLTNTNLESISHVFLDGRITLPGLQVPAGGPGESG